jgi:pilus assembly protein CpaB
MNQRFSGILVIALFISAIATYVVYRVVAARTAQSGPQGVMVVRAARTLSVGTLLQAGDVTTGSWVGTPPPGMVTKKEAILNRGVIQTIYEGEPLMESRLAGAGAGGGLAATIPPGMRAVAVRVNDIVGVAGFVQPGMRVDVLIAGEVPEFPGKDGAHVKTILQNIEVLSAGQNYQKDADATGKPVVVQVVNLLVTPEQAEVLSLASNETRIQLVLRNPLDTQTVKTLGTSVAALYSGAAPDAPKPAAPAPRVHRVRAPEPVQVVMAPAPPPPPIEIEVLNGDKLTQAKFIPAGGTPQPVGAKQ